MDQLSNEEELRAALKWQKMTKPTVGFSADTSVKNPPEGGPTLSGAYEETTAPDIRLNIGEQGAGSMKGAETTLPLDNDVPISDEDRRKLLGKRKTDRQN